MAAQGSHFCQRLRATKSVAQMHEPVAQADHNTTTDDVTDSRRDQVHHNHVCTG